MPEWLAWPVLVVTAATLAFLLPFALHRTSLLVLARGSRPEFSDWVEPLPPVTVQLPVFNEAMVVERLIDAAAGLDYPPELLEIQLLDDSTDETTELAAKRVQHWQRRGIRIAHLRRPERVGFKAGALAAGMEQSRGDFILILDADFVPARDLIHRLLGPFRDPLVGVVQARWDHLNEGSSLFTRCQALLLDGHFFMEQGGRWASGRFMNFNGTAGMWRRSALEDAGGWSADTLTEDVDASYRAQMAGWRFVFRPAIGVPAEIPEEIRALEVQQKRWSQGGIQTGRKILPRLLRGPWSFAIKGEAVAHLMGHLAHPVTLLLGILLLPSALARQALGLEGLFILDLLVFLIATFSFLVFFCAAGRRRKRPWVTLVPTAALTMALGIGLTATVSRAVARGFLSRSADPFLRTPKRGAGGVRYLSPTVRVDLAWKVGLAGWMLICGVVAVREGLFMTLPFLTLFGGGYAWLALGEVRDIVKGGDGMAAAGRPPVDLDVDGDVRILARS